MAAALQAIRVLDLSENVAGQYCSRLMADFGADVTLIEPSEGSATRHMGPFRKDGGESLLFFHLNLGKKSVAFDCASPEGWKQFLDLARSADVVIVGRGPDRAALLRANPNAIVCFISDFGENNPLSDWRADEMIHQALSGVMYFNGRADREPLYGCGHRASYASGVAAYSAILAALLARKKNGGQEIEIRIAETATSMTYNLANQYRYNGHIDRRTGDIRTPDFRVRCANGWIGIFIYPYRWRDSCVAIGAPELADDLRFADPTTRMKNWLLVQAEFEQRLQMLTCDEAVKRLQANGAVAAKSMTPQELAVSDHLAARTYWEEIEGRRILGAPFRLSKTPRSVKAGAPALAKPKVVA